MSLENSAYIIEWLQHGAICSFTGDLVLETVLNCDEEVFNSQKINDTKYLIYNFADAKLDNIELEEAQLVSATDIIRSGEVPSLLLLMIAKDELTKYLCEYYVESAKKLYSSWQFEIVQELEEAKSIIDELGYS